ncbi:MAG: LysE family transporter, partial [bacterium]
MVDSSVPVFLLSVVFISLSGVIMPGPVFAATVARGYSSRHAGAWIALGHGAVEFPLIALIYVGIRTIFENPLFMVLIGVVGGATLVYMGYEMIRLRMPEEDKRRVWSGSSLLAGVATTAANPYFFLWWATIGAALVVRAMRFGAVVVLVFAVLHWACDLGWDYLVAHAVYKTQTFWGRRLRRVVFTACGLLLVGFGIWFIVSPLTGRSLRASSFEREYTLGHIAGDGRIFLQTPDTVCVPALTKRHIDPHLVSAVKDRVPETL